MDAEHPHSAPSAQATQAGPDGQGLQRRQVLGAAAALATATLAPRARAATPALRLSWWGGSDRHKRTLAVAAAFEARNPGVRIKPEYMGFNGYTEKLTMQMVGETEPDIMQVSWPALATFSRRGDGFYDLYRQRELIALDQFSADDQALCTVKGRLNGLPTSFTARIFLWNKAAFARAGLGLPQTWDDFLAAGPVFKSRLGPRAYPMDGEPYDMLLLSHCHMLQRFGMHYIDPTRPRVMASAEALLHWVRSYRLLVSSGAATPLRLRASLGGAEKPLEQQPDWVVGNWAGNYTWDTALRPRLATLDKQQSLDIGPFLTLPGAKNSGMFGRPTMLWVVSKNTRHPEWAARFLSFMLTDPEAARILSVTRGVPSAASAARTLQQENLISPLEYKGWKQIKDQRDAGHIDLPSPRFEDERMRRLMREIFELVSYERISDEEAAARLLDDGGALLSRMR